MWRTAATIAAFGLLVCAASASDAGAAQPTRAGANPDCDSGEGCEAIVLAKSPQDVYGSLFEAVQRARIFADSKTFADSIPRESPERILEQFRKERPKNQTELRAFVSQHFVVPEQGEPGTKLLDHIKRLWPQLTRQPLAPAIDSSAIGLPQAYVVPGGRFREIYYWDSYFTMLGLKADSEKQLIESMLANFVSLVERYGHVPNGTRTYYLSRSQPPFLALMMDLSDAREPALEMRRLDALKVEHSYWMAGASCLDAEGACQHVVAMPDGSLLNRYWDARDTPRDESYAPDVATAENAESRRAKIVYRDLRAGAESGWDFGSRWFKDGKTIATIHTTKIVPVDLNSLLWYLETSIARRCMALGNAACSDDFKRQADLRKATMSKYLWSGTDSRFVDWDLSTSSPTPSISAAILYPLFVGLATADQADATASLAEEKLVALGGLRTSTVHTGEQWDQPNGWAPLLWIGVQGLDRYGKTALANELASRWLKTVSEFFACTGRMVEKYDIENGQAGGGGEYPVQDGFGWTNGVTRALLERPGANTAVSVTCTSPP